MKKTLSKKTGIMLTAFLLTLTIIFGSVQSVNAAKKDAGDYYIKINKATNVVTVYKKDGTPYTAFTCSIGYATPLGTFHTTNKYRWWVLDGPVYGQYCTRITGSILFHSVWYYRQSASTQSYRQYNKLGTVASHGCCRLTVAASKWIYDNCPAGTKVIIFNGKAKDDPLGKPKTIKVKGTSGWDPTDPASGNPYKTKSTKPVIKVSKKTYELGSKFTDQYMSCKDSGGFDITDWVKRSGKVNTKKVGSYRVKYSVIDSFGRTATKTVTYQVVDNNGVTLTGVKELLTKDLGSTRNMLVGLKAKDTAGNDLTNEIRVFIKTPRSASYVECETNNYTFTEVGTYLVKYVVANPNNGFQTVKKQTITVKSGSVPSLVSSNNWDEIDLTGLREVSWESLMSGVTAKMANGTDITDSVEITALSPDGDSTTIIKGQRVRFDVNGIYTLTYSVANFNTGDETRAEHERTLIVAFYS